MKALVVKEFDDPLILEDLLVPQPAADEAIHQRLRKQEIIGRVVLEL